jgi:glucans biosynthesis protein
MHGGNNPGAPVGNRNAWKHGLRSGEFKAMRDALRGFARDLDGLC